MAKNNTKTPAKTKTRPAVQKTTSAKSQPDSTATPRIVKQSTYKSFKLQKRVKRKGPPMPTALQIFRTSFRLLRANWKLFAIIALLYGIVNVVFIQSFGLNNTVSSTKDSFDSVFTGSFKHVFAGIGTFVSLIGTSGQSSSSNAGPYQIMWVLVVSLATIWALRETYAGNKVRVREAFYNGMYPFVPFVLVMMVILLEFVPFVAGGMLFTTIVANNIAATGVELSIWAILFFLLTVLTIYMISSTMFALYISCQPGMTPMPALRSTRQLVVNRRWAIIRKILFLPFMLLIINGIFLLPVILIYAPAAIWVFYVLVMVNLMITHSYYYALYRSLLD